MESTLQTAIDLYEYSRNHFWNGKSLIGPDPGVRWNRVLWRFLKSMLPFVNWNDDRYMLQCQGYWIRNNWTLFHLTGEARFRETAILASGEILKQQHVDGYWTYALPGWKGRIATVEGDYAALGLLATYRETGDPAMLDGAVRWYRFLITHTGFEEYRGTRCIRYFAGHGRDLVPNNATLTLEFFGELAGAAGDPAFLEHADGMIRFLELAQLDSGELPYSFDVPWAKGRTHFMCYQYNAFQFLDLASFYQTYPDATLKNILHRSIGFLRTGLHPDGHCRYACGKDYPEVTYYTAVLAAAFLKSSEIGLRELREESEAAYRRLLQRRRKSGNYVYSTRNYGWLRDTRAYPRYLSMILKHWVMRIESEKKKPEAEKCASP